MKKIMFASLILVLLGALIMPAIAVSAPVAAYSATVTCNPTALHFRVYVGVPTYLWGFIPLDDGQVLTITHDQKNLESAGWTLSDDASWLQESMTAGVVGCVLFPKSESTTVRVNTDGLTAGTLTATITFTFTTCGTKTITVPVTVDVIQPMVMGPLCIGVDEDLLKGAMDEDTFAAENNYTGLTVQLLTNPADMMDMQAIETTGSWSMLLKGGIVNADGSININTDGSILTIGGVADPITWGMISGIGSLMSMMGSGLPGLPANFDWGNNYAAMFATASGQSYIGIVIADINALLPLVNTLLNPPAPTEPDTDTPPVDATVTPTPEAPPVTEDMVIPLKPIMNMLPSLMPVISDFLGNETLMAILSPILDLLPPIAVVMPLSVMMQLASGIM
jgi:hypothetical protein